MAPVHVELDRAQLKVTHTALRSLLGDLRHDDHDVRQVVREVLAQLPPAEEVEAIDLDRELARRGGAAA